MNNKISTTTTTTTKRGGVGGGGWEGSGGGGGGKTLQRYEIDKLSRHKHTRAHTLPHTRTNQTMNNSLVRTS